MKHVITKHTIINDQPATVLWFDHTVGKRAVIYLELFDAQNKPLITKTRYEFQSHIDVKQFSASIEGLYLPHSFQLTFISLFKKTVGYGLCDGKFESMLETELHHINTAAMLS